MIRVFVGAIAAAAASAMAVTRAIAANPLGPGQLYWILNATDYDTMLSPSMTGTLDTATLLNRYFNTAKAFIIVYKEDSSRKIIIQNLHDSEVVSNLPNANLALDVLSESTLEPYLSSGSLDPKVTATMYDDEGSPTEDLWHRES